MPNNNSITSIKVGGGTVAITEETIQIDISPFGSLKRFYEQSKLFVGFFIGGMMMVVVVFILDPSPYYRTLSRYALIFVIVGFTLVTILPKLMNNIATASELDRTAVERVEYTTGSRVISPRLRIIVDDGERSGVRPVPLSYYQLGDQQLEAAIQAFEDAGIDIVPADDTPDEDG